MDSIHEKGLMIEVFSGNRTVKGIREAKSLEDAGWCDLVIIVTKAYDVLATRRYPLLPYWMLIPQ